MTFAIRNVPWVSGFALCALAGCCATHRAACSNCATDVVVQVPSTYENYTPPQPALSPIPLPPTESNLESPDAPPPPETRNIPNKNFDFFDAAKNDDLKTFRR